MENAIEVSHLSFAYTEEAETIKDVSFTIPKGSYTTIIGLSLIHISEPTRQ